MLCSLSLRWWLGAQREDGCLPAERDTAPELSRNISGDDGVLNRTNGGGSCGGSDVLSSGIVGGRVWGRLD